MSTVEERTIAVRGPRAEWVDSRCPTCGSWYFDCSLQKAQASHDQGPCRGILIVSKEDAA